VQVVAASLGAMVETYIAPTAAAPSKKPFVITVMTRDTDTGGGVAHHDDGRGDRLRRLQGLDG
jgi:hypothetical protein